MASLPAVAKGVRVDFHFKQAEDANIQIREFFQYSGTLSTADAVTWLGQMQAGMASFLGSFMSNTLSLTLSELTDLSSNTAPQVQNSTGAAGGSSDVALPAGTAMVLRKHINRRYRGGHPRVYLPGMHDNLLHDANTWDTTALANGVADYITFISACTALTGLSAVGTATHVNISYFQGFTNHTYPSGRVKAIPNPRVTPVVDTITNISGNPNVASQRRRNETP